MKGEDSATPGPLKEEAERVGTSAICNWECVTLDSLLRKPRDHNDSTVLVEQNEATHIVDARPPTSEETLGL